MTDSGLFKPRWVRCPACGRKALYAAENAARPFCSPRCRGTDLGAWASENYRVAAEPPADTDESPLPVPLPPGPAH